MKNIKSAVNVCDHLLVVHSRDDSLSCLDEVQSEEQTAREAQGEELCAAVSHQHIHYVLRGNNVQNTYYLTPA